MRYIQHLKAFSAYLIEPVGEWQARLGLWPSGGFREATYKFATTESLLRILSTPAAEHQANEPPAGQRERSIGEGSGGAHNRASLPACIHVAILV
eukprot:4101775-Pyramimonas_sp.AAC.1